ncbi:putative per-hexamer repeat protein 5 [Penaeus japonicus]|uniref:putative per-hexamer repeat protein 5 n=1 Tax=Penaeus japonicus TaxID=27405 RepID=UPI001C70B6D4|nr:putative per-hexamer repeat protein 5 [Penaeus japonicus]
MTSSGTDAAGSLSGTGTATMMSGIDTTASLTSTGPDTATMTSSGTDTTETDRTSTETTPYTAFTATTLDLRNSTVCHPKVHLSRSTVEGCYPCPPVPDNAILTSDPDDTKRVFECEDGALFPFGSDKLEVECKDGSWVMSDPYANCSYPTTVTGPTTTRAPSGDDATTTVAPSGADKVTTDTSSQKDTSDTLASAGTDMVTKTGTDTAGSVIAKGTTIVTMASSGTDASGSLSSTGTDIAMMTSPGTDTSGSLTTGTDIAKMTSSGTSNGSLSSTGTDIPTMTSSGTDTSGSLSSTGTDAVTMTSSGTDKTSIGTHMATMTSTGTGAAGSLTGTGMATMTSSGTDAAGSLSGTGTATMMSGIDTTASLTSTGPDTATMTSSGTDTTETRLVVVNVDIDHTIYGAKKAVLHQTLIQVYSMPCGGCDEEYIGKTRRELQEQGTDNLWCHWERSTVGLINGGLALRKQYNEEAYDIIMGFPVLPLLFYFILETFAFIAWSNRDRKFPCCLIKLI